MKKVTINSTTSGIFGAEFPIEVEAQEWIDSGVAGNWWGLPDRWILETDGNHTDTRQVLEQEAQEEKTVMQMQYDVDGNELGEIEVVIPASEAVYRTEYFFPKEYEITITDITDEHERKERLENLKVEAAKNLKDLQFGASIIALVGKINDERNLTHEQKDAMMVDQGIMTIMGMLQAGRIGRARQLINAFEVDGMLLTEQSKSDILQLVDDYLETYHATEIY